MFWLTNLVLHAQMHYIPHNLAYKTLLVHKIMIFLGGPSDHLQLLTHKDYRLGGRGAGGGINLVISIFCACIFVRINYITSVYKIKCDLLIT